MTQAQDAIQKEIQKVERAIVDHKMQIALDAQKIEHSAKQITASSGSVLDSHAALIRQKSEDIDRALVKLEGLYHQRNVLNHLMVCAD